MALNDWKQSLGSSVGNNLHVSHGLLLGHIHYSKYSWLVALYLGGTADSIKRYVLAFCAKEAIFLCTVCKWTLHGITFMAIRTSHLRFMTKQRFVNLHNLHYQDHPVEWSGQQFGPAEFPEPLVGLSCSLSTHLGFLCSLTRWILSYLPVNEDEPLLQSQAEFAETLPSRIERNFRQVLTAHLHLNIASVNIIIYII